MLKIHHNGAEAIVHGYLQHRETLRFLSLGGSPEAVKAILAGLLAGRETTLLRCDDTSQEWCWESWLSVDPGAPHHIVVQRLPSGCAHGLLYPHSATLRSTDPAFTLLLPTNHAPAATDHFFALLNARTTLPLHPSWAHWLHDQFVQRTWIASLAGDGPWVGWDAEWEPDELRQLVADAIATGSLTTPMPGDHTRVHAA